MEPTTFPGPRTSTSQCTADPAGPKEPPLPLLTDSTSSSETRTQLQLLSMLRSSSTAVPVEAAKVETQEVSTNSPTMRESQTPPASNTSPTTPSPPAARPSTSARTAPGHHAQSARPAKTNAGLSSTRTTMPPTTTASPASNK